ncbi:hypothetical protein [Pelagerythrobacter rhizovicinus]|nr:hypothetical protein [Pelagerythrobacter rhizovicinus]
MSYLGCALGRHAELVSAFIAPSKPAARAEKWTLKQVQGDEIVGAGNG